MTLFIKTFLDGFIILKTIKKSKNCYSQTWLGKIFVWERCEIFSRWQIIFPDEFFLDKVFNFNQRTNTCSDGKLEHLINSSWPAYAPISTQDCFGFQFGSQEHVSVGQFMLQLSLQYLSHVFVTLTWINTETVSLCFLS